MRKLLGLLLVVFLSGCEVRTNLPLITYDAERAKSAIAAGAAYAYVKGGWNRKGSDSAEEFLKYRSLARKIDVFVIGHRRFDWQKIGLRGDELRQAAPEAVDYDRLFIVVANITGPEEMAGYSGKQYLILECDAVLGWDVAGSAKEEWYRKMAALSPKEG